MRASSRGTRDGDDAISGRGTHSETRPSPSRLDLQTWRHVAGNNAAGNTGFLIKGYECWWAGLAAGNILVSMSIVSQEGGKGSD